MKLAVYVTAHRHWAFLLGIISGLATPTGEESPRTTGCTFDSSCKTSLACEAKNRQFEFPRAFSQQSKPTRSHNRRTSSSANCLHVIKLSIHPSSVGMDPGSLVGERWCGSGDLAVSISMLLSMVGTAGVHREEGPAGGRRGGLVRKGH